ncbi:MAG TPA: alpha/beta fold hydrolase [Thermoanaerobaculia bacterium]
MRRTERTSATSWCIAVPLALALAAAPVRGQAGEDWTGLGRAVTLEISTRQFDKTVARFDETMTAVLPAATLAATWDGLLGQVGAFRGVTATRQQEAKGYHLVFVTCRFDKATLDVKIAFDARQRIAGLFFVPTQGQPPAQAQTEAPAQTQTRSPSQAQPEWAPPEYARPSAFHERTLTVGASPWELPGTLAVPNGTGPFPAVVLVHGSGPEDQDETIGPNRPFKDLAWGLASRGIAVLRYDKRTLRYGSRLRLDSGTFTVRDETVDDARTAVALAAAQPEIDRRRIFVLGHSLGGTLAPRIAQGDPRVAGLVLMGGGARPLGKVLVEQVRYVASLGPGGATAGEAQIRAAERAAREIDDPALTPTTMIDLLGTSIAGSYFLDLRSYHPAAAAAELGIPVLVLQAARDYQVTMADFEEWKAALAHGPRAVFKLYPGLYHLFMPSTTAGAGLGSPADYQRPAHVAAPVIDDIARWIASR